MTQRLPAQRNRSWMGCASREVICFFHPSFPGQLVLSLLAQKGHHATYLCLTVPQFAMGIYRRRVRCVLVHGIRHLQGGGIGEQVD
jgi:hypothetical protein